MKLLLRSSFKHPNIDHAPRKTCLLENIVDALETSRKWLKVWRRPHSSYLIEPGLDIPQSRHSNLENSIYFVVFEAANLAEIVLDAFQQERVQFALRQRIQAIFHRAFDKDFHHTLGR